MNEKNNNRGFAQKESSKPKENTKAVTPSTFINLLNVINFSNWTYFNSEKISTKVYDVEISASLYEQLLPSEYKERSIKEDEVVCIQYRKSVVSEEQDQFLISRLNKNNFMLLQQKEIQIDVELKNKIKSICNSYIEPQNNNSYTNEILDKIKAAGIEVVTDKDEFERILNTERSIQKMTSDIEKLKELQISLDDKKLQEKEIELAEQAQLQSEKELQEKYFKKFVNNAKEYQDYIPVGELEKFSWVYYNSESKQLISDSKMRTENSKGHVAMMNVCLFKDISGDLHLGVYEDDSNFIEDISSIYNLTKEKISTPAGQTDARNDRELTDLNIYLDTFKKFALENDIANTFPAKIISRYENEINSLETKNAVRISSLEKSQDDYNTYENRITGKSNESNVFNYKGYTFLPVRYFKPGDEYETVKENLTWKDAIIRIPHTGTDFSINDFYAAADKNGNADIFYCVEKGKFFTLSEAGIHSLNDGKRNKELYDSELEEFRVNNAELLSKLNKFSFNEEKDTLLMSNIAEVLELGEVFEKENETLGIVRIRKGTGINANGILHIIKRRIDKKMLHNNEDFQKAIEETSAIMFCAVNNIDMKPAVKETNGRWAVFNNGIKTAIDKDKNGYFVVTGFDLDETNQEATETINAVNARYGYKPEFHEIYAQVGAAYASLKNRLSQQGLDVNEQLSSLIQKMVTAENTYGFVHNGKIYLNPEIMNSNAAIHEYTHLWDAYTQKTNPELWEKGKEIFKQTYLWNEVKNDSNYADISEDEDLVLSECHARVTGKIASAVLEKIALENGSNLSNAVIDWDREVMEHCQKELGIADKELTGFISMTMRDLMAEKSIASGYTKATQFGQTQGMQNAKTERKTKAQMLKELERRLMRKIERNEFKSEREKMQYEALYNKTVKAEIRETLREQSGRAGRSRSNTLGRY